MNEILKQIKAEAEAGAEGAPLAFMEFCGGHTYALAKNGILSVLPRLVKMVHGPGCPVCVLPTSRIKMAVEIARDKGAILCIYGDVLRVPDEAGFSLFKARAEGADVRVVYSPMDALTITMENKNKRVVFFAIGFETSAPLTAAVVQKARELRVRNFFVFANHIVAGAAMEAVLAKANLDGVIAPGHVAAITGAADFRRLAAKFSVPMVVSGFEVEDLLQAILGLIKLAKAGKYVVQNNYAKVVEEQGNLQALKILNEVFAGRKDFAWRGLGILCQSAFDFAADWQEFDAEKVWQLAEDKPYEPKGCICPLVITGKKEPFDCPLFAKVCNPANPVGACMVSSEGTCGAYYKYQRKK